VLKSKDLERILVFGCERFINRGIERNAESLSLLKEEELGEFEITKFERSLQLKKNLLIGECGKCN
jgi:hypothetical protein